MTEGLLGDRYVTVSRGLTGTIIPKGGVIPAEQQVAMQDVIARSSALMDNLSSLIAQVQKGNGTVGKSDERPGALQPFGLHHRQGRFHGGIDSTRARNAWKLVASDELYNKANSAVGKVDDVLTAVQDQKGTIGHLVYDPALYNNVKGATDKTNALLGDVRAGKGTLGKLVTDDALYTNCETPSANVRDASAKMNSNQGTIGKCSTIRRCTTT